MTADVSECGCRWERDPSFGDVIVEPCAAHRSGFMAAGAHKALGAGAASEHQLDRELDDLVRKNTSPKRRT